ncbi:Maf family protein [Hydrogenibacillus schlegelii]|uniref:dTTP/UTP pyrophosphatase n=1 Tax=Hydrogenibacillus schlegelii TaxID=1484 RepID=A0A132MHL4_HYDSH|nr:Maf family protein [Hydrogenibacillus schlegelii]KWW97327.1 hypothetical protein TR75_09225 [Hydrogenibacillus schlegelii]MBT9282815.1 septum formation protein Maf [Hydrogenibacillus schlegelii]PTQ54170.1 MAG: Septum formation protein Maf [Hydrogenibacillus schlegelii]
MTVRSSGLPPVVLASGSPRRSALLAMVGVPFDVLPADVDEAFLPGEEAEAAAVRLARLKGEAARRQRPDALVLAFDTIVALEDRLFGKPRDGKEAAEMLRALSGRTHRVVTGLYAALGGRVETAAEVARVTMVPLSEDVIRTYVATGEPMDKSGAYAVQGRAALFVERIDGDYTNVVGLPLFALRGLVRRLGIDLADYWTVRSVAEVGGASPQNG